LTVEKSMSRYLVERILAMENIDVMFQTGGGARGGDHLEGPCFADGKGSKTDVRRTGCLSTRRTPHRLARRRGRDERGFTGRDLVNCKVSPCKGWTDRAALRRLVPG
jgi:hypothetical protein